MTRKLSEIHGGDRSENDRSFSRKVTEDINRSGLMSPVSESRLPLIARLRGESV